MESNITYLTNITALNFLKKYQLALRTFSMMVYLRRMAKNISVTLLIQPHNEHKSNE